MQQHFAYPRTIWILAAFAVSIAVTAASLAVAQTSEPIRPKAPVLEKQQPPPFGITKDGKLLIVGETCQRRTDGKVGRIGRDFCGRYYCGQANTPDLSEVIPDWPQRHGCTFRLVGQECKCLTADGQPRRVHKLP